MPFSVLNVVTFVQICVCVMYHIYHVSFMVVKSYLGNSSATSKDSHLSLFNKIKSILFFTFRDLVDLKLMIVDSMWQRSSPPAPTGTVTCAQGSAMTSLCRLGSRGSHCGLPTLVLWPICLSLDQYHAFLLVVPPMKACCGKVQSTVPDTLLLFPPILAAPASRSF